MAKDKKGKNEGKKAKLAAKKEKQASKGEKKAKVKAAKVDGSDAEDVDLDAVLEEYKKQQEQFHKITETVADGPPRARSAATFLANPSNSNQLLLFGGEYFNGSLATFFNDLMIYYIDRDEWRCVTSPNAPLPRSGHAWTRGGNQSNAIYLFGGEFSSPKQGTFYHYNDFWKLDPTTREWTRLEPKGKTPPARSGHRMTYFKNYIILFGGFQDTANQTKYLSDLWIYDTTNFVWYNPALPRPNSNPTPAPPSPSSHTTKAPSSTAATPASKPPHPPTNNNNPAAATNTPALSATFSNPSFTPTASSYGSRRPGPTPPPPRRKKPANAPNPTRAGTTMAFHKGRGILFGGVHDVQESEEGIESEFFNALFAWNVERNRFFPLALRKSRVGGGGGVAVQDDVLYIYGGTFEKGEREFTFDDLYAVDLGKMDGCKEVFSRPVEDWVESEDEDDDEDDEDDYEDEEDEEGNIEMEEESKQRLFTESKRKKKQGADEVSNADSASTAPSMTPSEEEEETETVASSVDDGLPHPRPFESRRDFFQRTSNEWQEILMTNLRWKNIQPESLSIKEIKTKAFELSEEKWWDCREEITALEEEQEAAGIGEVVSLADRGEAGPGAGAGGGGGGRRR
ncbi:Kelch repeat-containing protein 3 [Collariella sp. IMI 366227]|nr:Kelch repeat-containing protein 3 [Collariella sp. IMI 366227]